MFYFEDYEDDIIVSISVAKTNKLYCSECKEKIKKGQEVIFILSKDNRGKLHMEDCYCSKCGEEIKEKELHYQALRDAFDIGQW